MIASNNVSVIIPVRNYFSRLRQVLYYLNQQDYPLSGFEVIVVDDGSDGNICDAIRGLTIEYPYKIVKHTGNRGRSAARNTGVLNSDGNILIFMDADRVPSNSFIREHIRAFNLSATTINIGSIIEWFIPNFDEQYQYAILDKHAITRVMRTARYFNFHPITSLLFGEDGITINVLRWLALASGNFSLSRKIYLDNEGFDEDFVSWGFENFEFGYRLAKSGFPFRYVQEAKNFHIYHSGARDGIDRIPGWELFKQKHHSEGPNRLLDFLDGKITLQQFERFEAKSLQCETVLLPNEKPIVYNKHKYGPRYKEVCRID